MSFTIQYYQSEAVNIKLADNNIVMTWLKPLTDAALRRNYLKALVIARNSKSSRWLIDARVLGKQFYDNIIWTVEEFFPSLIPFSSTATAIAYLLGGEEFENILQSNDNSPVLAEGSLLQIKLFREMPAAQDWLRKVNRHVPLKQA